MVSSVARTRGLPMPRHYSNLRRGLGESPKRGPGVTDRRPGQSI